MRNFFPRACVPVLHDNVDNSVTISFGGWWGHTLFQPLYHAGPQRDAVHAVFTTYSTADYVPTFADAPDLVRQTGMRGLPRLNHFVAMSPDRAAEGNALAVQTFNDRLRSAADTYREAVSVLNAAKQKPGQEEALLRDMTANVETVRYKTLGCGRSLARMNGERRFGG